MLKTFEMTIVRDKNREWQDEIQEICTNLRNRGRYPQGFTYDDNHFYIGGNINCDCRDKHDRMYCDGESDSCTNT